MPLQEFLYSFFEGGRIFQLAFPNDANLPFFSTQSGNVPKVTSPVLCQFWDPETSFRFRQSRKGAPSMAVPITPMNKDDFSDSWKDEVGFSRESGNVQQESVSE